MSEYWWYLHYETSIGCGFESVRMKFILYLFNKLLDVATLYLIVRKTNGRDCVVVLWSYPALNSRIVSSPPQTANNRSTTIGVSHVTLIARYRSVQSCPICSWRVAVRMRTKAFITSGSLGHKAALHHPSLVFLFTCNQFVRNYSLHMRSFILYSMRARRSLWYYLGAVVLRARATARI